MSHASNASNARHAPDALDAPIVGVLLAGGFARRFVAQAGVSKLLVPLKSGLPLALQTATVWKSALDQVLAVVPPEKPALERLFIEAGCEIVVAARAHEGMGASLASGIAAARARAPRACGWLVGLADMPFVQAATLRALRHALIQGAAMVAPTYDARRGNPVGFAALYGAALEGLRGDEGARRIVGQAGAALSLLAVDDPGIHADIDTPQDLETWQT